MESVQCVRNKEISVQLTVEEKASVDEIVKQAEFSLESQEVLAGALKNQTKGSLTIMATQKYEGHIVKNFPNPLKGADAFSMAAILSQGVKAAVVYSGKNKAGVECAWLLAFADTEATGRRIYAECGPKGKFSNIDWADVEDKLKNAGTVAKSDDKETGTSLYAAIAGDAGKSAVGAAFLG